MTYTHNKHNANIYRHEKNVKNTLNIYYNTFIGYNKIMNLSSLTTYAGWSGNLPPVTAQLNRRWSRKQQETPNMFEL